VRPLLRGEKCVHCVYTHAPTISTVTSWSTLSNSGLRSMFCWAYADGSTGMDEDVHEYAAQLSWAPVVLHCIGSSTHSLNVIRCRFGLYVMP
jgi:hypothetical protein